MNIPIGNASDCCGGPPSRDVNACCVKDEMEKQKGNKGCGCSDKTKENEPATEENNRVSVD